MKALTDLKRVLKEALTTNVMQKEIGAYTGTTLMISQSDQGLNCAKLYDPEQELIYMTTRHIDNMTVDLFSTVSS